MPDLTHIELSDLFDMLSVHTDHYMKMLSEGASREEFNKCRETIIDIQTEIHKRQNQKEQTADGDNNPHANRFPKDPQRK
jgi:hypothetical protein